MLSTKLRILCAEPHDDTSSMLNHLLAQANYEIRSAKTIAEALRLARSQLFNLYLLSDRYEDGTAVELCKEIRKYDISTPVLFYSTYARESDRQSGMSAGAQGYLTKPGGIFELTEVISRLIKQAESVPVKQINEPAFAPSAIDEMSLAAASEGRETHTDQKLAHEIERRRWRRIYEPFATTVYGADESGQEFEAKTTLDNLSGSGLYLRLAQAVKQGTKLSFIVRPSFSPGNEAPAPYIAVNGVVLRAEPQPDGIYGLGVALHNTDFFEVWSWALR